MSPQASPAATTRPATSGRPSAASPTRPTHAALPPGSDRSAHVVMPAPRTTSSSTWATCVPRAASCQSPRAVRSAMAKSGSDSTSVPVWMLSSFKKPARSPPSPNSAQIAAAACADTSPETSAIPCDHTRP